MKKLFISVDVEPDLHTEKYESLKAIPEFLKLLKKYNAKATFFVTCDCIEKDKKLFKKIKKEGHEIALHGYRHERFDDLNYEEKIDRIKKSKEYLKKNLNLLPKGFRAPQHSIDKDSLKILKENGFSYDSSISPWNFYHIIFFWKSRIKKTHNFYSMKIKKRAGIFEIPLTSIILPFSSLTVRVLPKKALRAYFRAILLMKNPVFIMHSWDLIPVPESKIYRKFPLDRFSENFKSLLEFFSKRRKFSNIEELTTTIQQ